MNGRAFAGWVLRGSLMLVFVLATGLGAISESATYFGVTFPHGDLAFADRVVDYMAASCVRDAYDDPEEALGPPDACAAGCEGCNGCDTNAVSLGFRVSVLDQRGYLIIEFVDNILIDVAGADLFVYITNDRPARVEISSDGFHYVFVGETVGYPGAIDIGPYAAEGTEFRFVRLSDVPADEDHSKCPGPSIDAIGAMGPAIQVIEGEAFGSLELQAVGDLAFAFDYHPSSFMIILDTSSSMGDRIDGDLKIDIAKDVILDLLDNLPESALVGFRTFGSCGRSRLIAPIATLERDLLKAEVQGLEPGGATPIALALELAKGDFEAVPDPKLILLVSDGMETCGGDPVSAAKDLLQIGYDLRIHVVGFDVGQQVPARDQLIEIARSTGGLYYDARSSEELRRALSLVAPFSYTVYDEEGETVFEGRIGQDGPSLPAGVYTVVIDTSPPITLTSVVVQGQLTTLITVEQADGGFHAEVGN
jgi:hypothetical protein